MKRVLLISVLLFSLVLPTALAYEYTTQDFQECHNESGEETCTYTDFLDELGTLVYTEENCQEDEVTEVCLDFIMVTFNNTNFSYSTLNNTEIQIDIANSLSGEQYEIPGDLKVEGTVYADEVAIHSKGFKLFDVPEFREEIFGLRNTEDGDIDKTTVDPFFLVDSNNNGEVDQGDGIRFWEYTMSLLVSGFRHAFDIVGGNSERLDTIEESLCNQGASKYC